MRVRPPCRVAVPAGVAALPAQRKVQVDGGREPLGKGSNRPDRLGLSAAIDEDAERAERIEGGSLHVRMLEVGQAAEAVEILAACRGKVIVAGVQKARAGATVQAVEAPGSAPAPVASN